MSERIFGTVFMIYNNNNNNNNNNKKKKNQLNSGLCRSGWPLGKTEEKRKEK